MARRAKTPRASTGLKRVPGALVADWTIDGKRIGDMSDADYTTAKSGLSKTQLKILEQRTAKEAADAESGITTRERLTIDTNRRLKTIASEIKAKIKIGNDHAEKATLHLQKSSDFADSVDALLDEAGTILPNQKALDFWRSQNEIDETTISKSSYARELRAVARGDKTLEQLKAEGRYRVAKSRAIAKGKPSPPKPDHVTAPLHAQPGEGTSTSCKVQGNDVDTDASAQAMRDARDPTKPKAVNAKPPKQLSASAKTLADFKAAVVAYLPRMNAEHKAEAKAYVANWPANQITAVAS